jgi:hypothetical protein
MTLKQQFEAMNMGETMLTDANRATVFVNAKRAGVTVSTTKFDDTRLEVTILRSAQDGEASLVDMIKGLSMGARLDLFAEFELCCGMSRGGCICPEEFVVDAVPFKSSYPSPAEVPDHQSRLERAREALAGVGQTKAVEPSTEPVEEDWRFTREPVMWDGQTPYRKQWMGADKPVYRVVEVDEFDPNTIVRVK